MPTLQRDDDQDIELETTKKLDAQHDEFIDADADADADAARAQQDDKDAGMWSEWQNLGILETFKTFRFTCLLCMMAAFSAATDGYQIGINGNIVANRGFVQQFGTITAEDGSVALAAPILSGWNSCINVGQIIAMLAFPPLSERFGRKFTLYLLWCVLSVSIIIECVAKTWQVWLVAKLIAGMGVGTLQFTIPCYIAELAPINVRGFLLTMYNFWWSVGGFFASIALQSLNSRRPDDFRIAIYTQWAQIGLMFCIYLFLPETPYWCASRGHHEKGKAVLRRLNGKVPGYDVDSQFEILVQTIEMERETARLHKRESWTAIFKGVDGFRTLLCAFPLLAQGMLGLSLVSRDLSDEVCLGATDEETAFLCNASTSSSTAGLSDPFIRTCVFNAVQLVAIITVSTLSDRLGRRILFCSGLGFMWLTCLIVGALGASNLSGQGFSAGLVFITCLWAIGVQMSGSTGFTYLGELPSARHRTRTTGAGFALQNPIGIAIGYGVPYMLSDDYLGWGLKTGFFYAGLGAPFAIGSWFLMPETSRRSAAELDELFEGKVRPWRFHKTETSIERAAKEKGLKQA